MKTKVKKFIKNSKNFVIKHKVFFSFVLLVSLVASATIYITFGYFYYNTSVNGGISIVEADLLKNKVLYYIEDPLGGYGVTTVAPKEAYLQGIIEFNSEDSTCEGCTSNSPWGGGTSSVFPYPNGDYAYAIMKFNISSEVSLVSNTSDIEIKLYSVSGTACGSSCELVELNDSLRDLFKQGYAVASSITVSGTTYTSGCTNNATYSINYKTNSIEVTTSSTPGTNGATSIPEATCSIYLEPNANFAAKVLADHTIKDTFDPTAFAPTNEGLVKTQDDYGTTYVFRGAVDDNWVYFANFYWRIIRINGDGSVRLIWSGTTAPTSSTKTVMPSGTVIGSSKFGNLMDVSIRPYYDIYHGYHLRNQDNLSQSNTIFSYLNNWASNNSNLVANANYISDNTIFCSDVTAYTTSEKTTLITDTDYINNGELKSSIGTYYLGQKWTAENANLICPSEKDIFSKNAQISDFTEPLPSASALEQPIGLLTLPEYLIAGGSLSRRFSGLYLHTNTTYWTMSPSLITTDGDIEVYAIPSSGFTFSIVADDQSYGVRPVLSIISGARVTGTGAYNNPYVIVTS